MEFIREKVFFLPPEGKESGHGKVNFLNGLRALSVIMVVATHCYVVFIQSVTNMDDGYKTYKFFEGWLLRPLCNGDLGVDIFFILSGYLIAMSFTRNYTNFKSQFSSFVIRRLFRILPAVIFALIVHTIYYRVETNNAIIEAMRNACNKNWYLVILGMQNLFISLADSCLVQTWSICVELQFYLFSPMLLALYLNNQLWGSISIFATLIMSVFTRLIVIETHDATNTDVYTNTLYIQAWTRATPFILGMILYLYQNRESLSGMSASLYAPLLPSQNDENTSNSNNTQAQPKPEKKVYPADVGHIVFALCSIIVITAVYMKSYQTPKIDANTDMVYMKFKHVMNRIIFSVGVIGWMWSCLNIKDASNYFCRFLSHRYWNCIAELSYSIYLYQMMIFCIIRFHIFGLDFVLDNHFKLFGVFITVFSLSFLIALPSYYFVEQPFINVGKWVEKKLVR